MHHIRPYKVFTLVQADRTDPIVRIPIPARRGTGSISLLETFLAIAASKVVGATRIFEFGTFMGGTTLNLALNTPEDARIFTLDLGASHAQAAEQHPADTPLTRTHLEAENALDFSENPVRSKITTLKGDSTKFDFGPWADSIDLVFIDGGHDVVTAKSDTESALRMARKDRPACILWHDYHNWEYAGLTQYLDDLSQEIGIFHIQDTMLCVWFNDHGGPFINHMASQS